MKWNHWLRLSATMSQDSNIRMILSCTSLPMWVKWCCNCSFSMPETFEIWMGSSKLKLNTGKAEWLWVWVPWFSEHYYFGPWMGLHCPRPTLCEIWRFSWTCSSCSERSWPRDLLHICVLCTNYVHSWTNSPFSQSPIPWSVAVWTIIMLSTWKATQVA